MRRRIALVVAMAVVLSAVGASAVVAQSGTVEEDGIFKATANQIIQCAGQPCIGTGGDDLMLERRGNGLNDTIRLRGGDNQVRAQRFTRDRDRVFGSAGYDLIYVNDRDRHDRIRGGRGDDRCFVDSRVEVVSGCSVVRVRR